MPVANSRFSRPRATSPRASDGTLPCSAVRCAAMSVRCSSTSWRIRNRISVRLLIEVARQAGKAATAARTTVSTSSAEAKSTSRASCPAAGSKTGPERPEVPGTRWPSIQWLTRSPVPEVVACCSATCVMRASLGRSVCRSTSLWQSRARTKAGADEAGACSSASAALTLQPGGATMPRTRRRHRSQERAAQEVPPRRRHRCPSTWTPTSTSTG